MKEIEEILQMNGIIINNQIYKIGEYVYVKTDIEQKKRMVTGYTIRKGLVVFLVSCGSEPESSFYYFELSSEKDLLI